MKILAIETSCDETAICIIGAKGDFGPEFRYEVLGNALYSQVAIHAPYGGVYPNLAKREHARNLIPLLTQALQQSNLLDQGPTLDPRSDLGVLLEREPELLEQLQTFLATYQKPEIDCIAVTYGPGLEPALWVGVNLARALAIVWELPLVAVNHMEGHVVMSMVEEVDSWQLLVGSENSNASSGNYQLTTINFPMLSLLISGGHTELVLSRQWQQYEVIGQTRDDAVGEAFDKVARVLGLPYPGGPEISRLAQGVRNSFSQEMRETVSHITFTPPMLRSNDFDFSFSGIKTEVRKYVEQLQAGRSDLPGENSLDDSVKADIARAFEDAVTQVLVAKTVRAVEEYGAQTVLVGGGVSANTYIRERLSHAIRKGPAFTDMKLLVPPAELATDNALMIALAGYFHAIKEDFSDPATLRANGNLHLA